MALQILLNITLAFLWVLIVSDLSLGSLVLGYLIGIFPVYIIRDFLPGRFYLIRVYYSLKLIFVFAIELIKANYDLTKIIVSPKIDIHPGFFAYPCDLEEEWEITLLSALISLTPGTVIVAISDDYSTIYIHGINALDVDAEISLIKNRFEKLIEEVSRP
ncbi:Na+/H+ antiporter subunit E [Salinicoccus kekensis]|uniref:Multisubunit sodium/proton antiporter MrpE subunit n=1 Tax=Salinicoccus kekensis TaxID=714307 RepID=A0A285UV42_9STAP|nr:Na+/H+ antiporter subunit E [Salinicoccus kekensis]SOC44121.1 multisubunit sodium/proton antiporter MrpE subunit [Salinicoccus kekensis]